MAPQTPNATPSFYTFPSFNPGRRQLIYGTLLSLVTFVGIAFVFNFATSETLHTAFDNVSYGRIDPSPIFVENSDTPANETVVPLSLPMEVLRALAGSYRDTSGETITLVLHDRELNFQSATITSPLVPVSDHKLLFRNGAERWIEFSAPAGSIERLDFFDGRTHRILMKHAEIRFQDSDPMTR
ncbi:MAG TPA: hypothetical protein VE783_03570 [Candidatus Limnocylindrales bacterium]|nr:hypothetical protein [Candidatus Limnocylindrales bacterium]